MRSMVEGAAASSIDPVGSVGTANETESSGGSPLHRLRRSPFPATLRSAGEDTRVIPIADHQGEGPSEVPGDLHDLLMDKLKAMDAKGQGVFHEDITPIVSHLFPIGQPFRETEKVIAQRKLGALHRFKGKHEPGVEMFVTKFDVMLQVYGTAFVVVDFDFSGLGPDDMKLVNMHAFMRTSDM